MDNMKRYSQNAFVRGWQTCEWCLDRITFYRPWIPLAAASLAIGFAIGYLLVR